MNRIFVALITLLSCCILQAQKDTIKIIDLRVENNPLVKIDPVKGTPSDTAAKLYHFSFRVNNISNIRSVRLALGTSAQTGGNIANLKAEIIDDKGAKILKAGHFSTPIYDLPIAVNAKDFPRYIFRFPAEMYDVQAAAWKYAEIVLEDNNMQPVGVISITRP